MNESQDDSEHKYQVRQVRLGHRSFMAAKDSLLDIRNSFQSYKPLKYTKLLFDTYSVSYNKMIMSQITVADVDVFTSCAAAAAAAAAELVVSVWNT